MRGWFVRNPPQPAITAAEFLRSVGLIVDLDQLLDNFSAKLSEMCAADSVYVILFEPITNRYVGKKAKGIQTELLGEINLSRSNNLIKWLNVNKSALDVAKQSEVIRFLSVHEQEILSRTRTQLVVPLIIVNRLTGAVFIAKESGFTETEITTISMVTSQSALAIEHTLMYQFQEDKLKKLFHADKLATIGELAAGAAHEIRNPLTSIRSTIQYVRKDLPEDKRPLVDGIIEEVDRVDRIIKGLLSFSKASELRFATISLHETIDQSLLLLEAELRKNNIEVHKAYQLSDPWISADASQLKQVFLNILLNSLQAMPRGGTIWIRTLDHQLPVSNGDGIVADRKGSTYIVIRDNGPGIAASDLPKIFDPFYTTKDNGTGLGLSISYGIVSKHGGEIDIKSENEGERTGTTVVVRLPKKRAT